MPNGYLPPVVLDILGDDSDLIRAVEEAKAAIASLADKKAEPTASLNSAPLEAGVAADEALLDALGKKVVSPTVAPHISTAALIGDKALADAVAGMRGGATANALAGVIASGAAGRGAGGGGGAATVLAADAASGGGGGGTNWLTLLRRAVWGGGSNVPFLGGLAGFGSLGALAGLGPEHLALTGVGIAGSAAGGLLGAGLLGLGAAGVAGVGMGTDLAGIGQAAGDIKTAVSDYNNLQQAIAVYGATSTQAQHAQALMNYHLAGFSQVARPAVEQARNAALSFKAMFDQWTGPAEGTGAQIITQAMQVAAQFLPTIGKFAATNMVIIQQGLQPLFQWIGGPGLKIFTDLEQQFTNQLPSAVHAFGQAFELIAKTIDVASHYTGGFVARLDEFLTKWNGVNFGRWQTEIGHLVGLFHTWWGLVSIVAKDIYQIFHADAGTGTAIVRALTQMLTHLHTWLQSTSGQASLHNVFTVHKKEILELLQVLPPLLKALGQVELIATPVMASLLTDIVKAIVPLINAISSIPGGSFVLGMAFLMRFGPLGGVLRSLSSIAMVPMAAGLTAIAKATGLMSAEGEVGFLGYVKGLGLLAAGLVAYEATTRGLGAIFGKPHPVSPSTSLTPQTRVFVRQYDASLAGTSPANLAGILGQPKPIVLPPPNASKFETFWTNLKHWLWTQWAAIDTDARHWVGNIERTADHGWQAVDTSARRWYGDVEQFIVRIWQGVYRDTTHWAGSAYQFVDQAWQRVDTDTRHWFGNVESFVGSVWSGIYRDVSGWANNIYRFLDSIWQRADTDVRHWFGDVESFFGSVWQGIYRDVSGAAQRVYSFLDSAWQRVDTDVRHWFGDVLAFFRGLPAGILGTLSRLPGQFLTLARGLIGNMLSGLQSINIGGMFGSWLHSQLNHALSFLGIHLSTVSESSAFFNIGASMMKSLAGGIISHAGHVANVAGAVAKNVASHVGSLLGLSGVGKGPAPGTGTSGIAAGFSQVQALGQSMAAAVGWTGAQWQALNAVVMAESGWNPTAQNPHSSAYGIAQNIQGRGGYPDPSVSGQISWLISYIAGRYGTPEAAWAHELSAGWYEKGGYVPNTGLAYLHAGETVIPAGQPIGGATFHNQFVMTTTADPHTVSNDLAWILGRQLAGLGH